MVTYSESPPKFSMNKFRPLSCRGETRYWDVKGQRTAQYLYRHTNQEVLTFSVNIDLWMFLDYNRNNFIQNIHFIPGDSKLLFFLINVSWWIWLSNTKSIPCHITIFVPNRLYLSQALNFQIGNNVDTQTDQNN